MTNTYLGRRLEGLTDDEWLWEPVPGCWSIRGGTVDWAFPEPQPVPVTTIAWRLQHIHACNEHELHSVLDEDFDWADVTVARSADEAVRLWETSASGFRDAVAALSDVDLEAMTKHGVPRTSLATMMVRENVHHGAEIGVLRDLYQHR